MQRPIPRREVFVDTSGWGHLVDAAQLYHQQAVTCYREARDNGRSFLTTSHILLEVVALLTSPLHLPRPKLVAFIENLKASPFVEVLHVDAEIDEAAWRLLCNRQDKEWSLVDCSSFVVMQRRGITEALTTDHHFEQAGFRRLLGE